MAAKPSAQSTALLQAEVNRLNAAVADWQTKYQQERKKTSTAEASSAFKLRQKGGRDNKIRDEIDNLKFQVFYGEAHENRELVALRAQVTDAITNNSQVLEFQEKMKAAREVAVEEWLFTTNDLAESLAVTSTD